MLGRPAARHELYLFWSRRKNLIKVLYLDPTGVCVFAKRINQGAFEVSFGQTPGQASVTLDAATLGSIVAATHSMNAKPRKRLASLAH